MVCTANRDIGDTPRESPLWPSPVYGLHWRSTLERLLWGVYSGALLYNSTLELYSGAYSEALLWSSTLELYSAALLCSSTLELLVS